MDETESVINKNKKLLNKLTPKESDFIQARNI